MPIIGFWSEEKKETAQTLSMVAFATYMAVEHNHKILVIDATFNSDVMGKCYWIEKNKNSLIKQMNKGKIDISAGAEGLVSAMASNKITPETIKTYSKIVFKDRLDVLLGLKTKQKEEFKKSISYYPSLLQMAGKYYDYVFVDMTKGNDEITQRMIKACDVVFVNLTQRLETIDKFNNLRQINPLFQGDNIIPLIGRYDRYSKYNTKNISRYFSNKGDKNYLSAVPYNTLFFEASNEAGVAELFLKIRLAGDSDKNYLFVEELKSIDKKLRYKLQELRISV